MTDADADTIVAVVLAEDFAADQAKARAHELACEEMRHGRTPEIRTAARLEVLRLEKAMVR